MNLQEIAEFLLERLIRILMRDEELLQQLGGGEKRYLCVRMMWVYPVMANMMI